MALDDGAFNAEMGSSVLKALRENDGIKAQREAIKGNAFSSGHLFGSITDGTTVNVYVENPAGSGVVIFPQSTYRSGGQIRFNKVDSVTVDSAGTTLSSQNRLVGDGSSKANVEHGVAWSGGNAWTEKVSGGAQGGGGLAPGDVTDFELILQEGDNVLYQLTNISGSSTQVSIDVDYIELDKDDISEFA